jgi:hypothetical protein
VGGQVTALDPGEELGVVLVHGGNVLNGARGDAGEPGRELTRALTPRRDRSDLGGAVEVCAPSCVSLRSCFAVGVELERDCCLLRSAEVAARECGQQHVLVLISRCHDPHWHALERQVGGGSEAMAPVQDDVGVGDLDRDEDAALRDVSAEGLILVDGHCRHRRERGMRCSCSVRRCSSFWGCSAFRSIGCSSVGVRGRLSERLLTFA